MTARRQVFTLLLSAWMLPGAASGPVDLGSTEFPTLWKRLYPDSAKICSPIRALKSGELSRKWRGRLTAIRVSCRPTEGSMGKESRAIVSATAAPGAVIFHGVPVVRISGHFSETSDSITFVLRGRYASIADRLSARLRQKCLKDANPTSYCKIERNVERGGIYMETNEVSALELYPDPANPAQTIYTWGWAD